MMKKESLHQDTNSFQCGNIVLHTPGKEHVCFGVGTLIKKTGDELWIVKFFDGREFEMINWALKKIEPPLTYGAT